MAENVQVARTATRRLHYMRRELMNRRLGDIAEVSSGFPFRGKVLPEPDGDLTVLQIKDLHMDGRLKMADALRVRSDRGFDHHRLDAGDVLFQSRGAHNPAAVFDGSAPAIAALGLHVIRLRENVLQSEYLRWYLNHPRTQERMRDLARGSTVAFITRRDAENLTIPAPPIAIQERIIAVDRLRREERYLAARLDQLRSDYTDNLMWRAAASNRINKA